MSLHLRGAGFKFLAAVCVGGPPPLLPGARWPLAGLWRAGAAFVCFVWRLRLGPGCAWVWVSVSPPALAGVLVWVCLGTLVVAPLFSRSGFAVFAVRLGFRPASHHSWLTF